MSNKDKNLCKAHGCKNKRTKKDRFCSKHRHRYNKENNFVNYIFHIWKSNCRRRGKENTVSLEEFKKICEETGYLSGKGRRPESMTIDRIDSSKGYSIENMQILSLSINSSKGNCDLEDFETVDDYDDLPF